MAITLVQTATGSSNINTGIQATWTVPTTSGGLLLAWVFNISTSILSVTPPAGWSLYRTVTNPGLEDIHAYMIENASSRSGAEVFSFSGVSEVNALIILAEYSGIAQSSSYVTSVERKGTGNPLLTESITTGLSNAVLVTGMAIRQFGGLNSPGSNFSLANQATMSGQAAAHTYYVVSASGTYSTNLTHSLGQPGDHWSTVMALFQGIAPPSCSFSGDGGPADPQYCDIPCKSWKAWVNGVKVASGPISGDCCSPPPPPPPSGKKWYCMEPPGIPCGDCTNTPAQFHITVGGVANGTCVTCNGYNGTFPLSFVEGCAWDTAVESPCSAGIVRYTLRFAGGEWQIGTFGSGILYKMPVQSWDCSGANIMTLNIAGPQCTNWPLTVTVTPV